MQNTGASLKKYHVTKFCVAALIRTENMCFSRCKRWSKTSEMHEANYSDKRSFKLCFLHNYTALTETSERVNCIRKSRFGCLEGIVYEKNTRNKKEMSQTGKSSTQMKLG